MLRVFDGEMKSFETYWQRWEAFAELKEFGEAIKYPPEDTDMPARHDLFATTDTDLEARQRAAMKRNRKAMSPCVKEREENKVCEVCRNLVALVKQQCSRIINYIKTIF